MAAAVSALESSRQGAGNVRWMAPELLDGSIPNSPEADVYSFACLAFHVLTDLIPFKNIANDTAIIVAIFQGLSPASKADLFTTLSNPTLENLTTLALRLMRRVSSLRLAANGMAAITRSKDHHDEKQPILLDEQSQSQVIGPQGTEEAPAPEGRVPLFEPPAEDSEPSIVLEGPHVELPQFFIGSSDTMGTMLLRPTCRRYVLTGLIPFKDLTKESAIIVAIFQGESPASAADRFTMMSNPGLENLIWALVDDCWTRQPGARPSMREIEGRIARMRELSSALLDLQPPEMPGIPEVYEAGEEDEADQANGGFETQILGPCSSAVNLGELEDQVIVTTKWEIWRPRSMKRKLRKFLTAWLEPLRRRV
ncbi:hypothetical protein FRC00_014380 [Tulasnella sp. 408]|nr:hypothetical protein FRC00_014380 [Tulasnella sp. 408]